MAITPELERLYLMNPVNAYYVEALSIYHEALNAPLHITNASALFQGNIDNDGTAEVVDFHPIPFVIQLPAKDTTGSQQLGVSISNVERRMAYDVEKIVTMPYKEARMFYRVFIYEDTPPTAPLDEQMTPAPQYDITSIAMDSKALTFTAHKRNMHNRRFPRTLYTAELFPGLDR